MLDALLGSLAERLRLPLPGERAHEGMRAMPLSTLRVNFKHDTPPRPGSVLVLLHEHDDGISFPLILRPAYDGTHGGQVSFPGGKAEPGETVEATALREAAEEIGINASQVELVGRLSDVYVVPSNFIVTPVVGIMHGKPQFRPDNHEVERMLTGRLESLLSAEAPSRRELEVRGYRVDAPCFILDGHVVWGATAMILNELRGIMLEMN